MVVLRGFAVIFVFCVLVICSFGFDACFNVCLVALTVVQLAYTLNRCVSWVDAIRMLVGFGFMHLHLGSL